MSLFNLKAVCRITGLTPDTLRAWERRYQAITPERSPNGRRTYSSVQLQRLKTLAELTKKGHSIGSIASLPDSKLSALSNASQTSADPNIEDLTEALLRTVDAYDLNKMEIELAKAAYSISPKSFLFLLIPQIMGSVGKNVETGCFDVGQEHAISEVLKKQIRRIYELLEPVSGMRNASILFTTPEGHLHEFGTLMAAVVCRYFGYQTHYLGPNLPSESLIKAVKKLKPTAVALGLSPVPATNYLQIIDAELPASTQIWLGGFIPKWKKKNPDREVWSFESVDDLEKKLN